MEEVGAEVEAEAEAEIENVQEVEIAEVGIVLRFWNLDLVAQFHPEK